MKVGKMAGLGLGGPRFFEICTPRRALPRASAHASGRLLYALPHAPDRKHGGSSTTTMRRPGSLQVSELAGTRGAEAVLTSLPEPAAPAEEAVEDEESRLQAAAAAREADMAERASRRELVTAATHVLVDKLAAAECAWRPRRASCQPISRSRPGPDHKFTKEVRPWRGVVPANASLLPRAGSARHQPGRGRLCRLAAGGVGSTLSNAGVIGRSQIAWRRTWRPLPYTPSARR
jgi:hypothetical protein